MGQRKRRETMKTVAEDGSVSGKTGRGKVYGERTGMSRKEIKRMGRISIGVF